MDKGHAEIFHVVEQLGEEVRPRLEVPVHVCAMACREAGGALVRQNQKLDVVLLDFRDHFVEPDLVDVFLERFLVGVREGAQSYHVCFLLVLVHLVVMMMIALFLFVLLLFVCQIVGVVGGD